jgi:hypothetical protein
MRYRKCIYGDLHIHSKQNPTDAADSIREFIKEAEKKDIQILGPSPLFSSMTKTKYMNHQKKLEEESNKGESLLLNCLEVEFKQGSFLVFNPDEPLVEKIGSFESAWNAYLQNPKLSRIILHPIPQFDIWHKRLLPGYLAVEVINGRVFDMGRRIGYTIDDLLELPMLLTFTNYLDAGIAVAAIGSSDSPLALGLGNGVTGFNYASNLHFQEKDVIESLEKLRSFAASDTGIRMNWQLSSGRLQWTVTIDGEEAENVQLYRGSELVLDAKGSEETMLTEPGNYWLGLLSGERMGISSAIPFFPVNSERLNRELIAARLTEETDIFLSYPAAIKEDLVSESFADHPIIVYAEDLRLKQLDGSPATYELKRTVAPVSIFEKDAPHGEFAELLKLLQKGSMYEFSFISGNLKKKRNILHLNIQAVPSRFYFRTKPEEIRELYEEVKTHIEVCKSIKLSIKTLPQHEIIIFSKRFPVMIQDGENTSYVHPRTPKFPEHFKPWLKAAGYGNFTRKKLTQIYTDKVVDSGLYPKKI